MPLSTVSREDYRLQSIVPPTSQWVWAASLAIVVHVGFLLLMLFSVNWKTHNAEAVAVQVWTAADLQQAVPAVPATPVPPPSPAPVEEIKPDIVLAEQVQAMKLKAQLEQQAQAKQAEQQQRLQQAQAKLALQAKQAQATKERIAAMQQLLVKETQSELSQQSSHALNGVRQQIGQSAIQSRMKLSYMDKIRLKIQSRILLPEGMQGNPHATFEVSVLPTGEVLNVRLVHASGQAAYDDAVQRAILKASPFPMPPDASVAVQFRDLNLDFSPQEEN